MIEGIENAYSNYGLPKQKKYPLPDRKHVLSAIRFFNYVSPQDEEQLAKAILEKIKEYGMKDVGVGPDNRFLKYYKKDVDHLEHHGIKGQQWGVHNGPPYPIQPGHGVKIDKGVKFKRLTVNDEAVAKGHAYVTYLKEDQARYKGFFSVILKASHPGATVFEISVSAAKDLISPSQKQRIDTFMKLYQNNKVEIGRELGAYHKRTERNAGLRFLPKWYYEKKYSDLEGDEVVKKGYRTFVKAIGGNEKIRNMYFDEFRKNGFDFIRDDQDSGRRGISPSIVMDREKNLRYEGRKKVSADDVVKAYGKYGGFVSKNDKHKEWESK